MNIQKFAQVHTVSSGETQVFSITVSQTAAESLVFLDDFATNSTAGWSFIAGAGCCPPALTAASGYLTQTGPAQAGQYNRAVRTVPNDVTSGTMQSKVYVDCGSNGMWEDNIIFRYVDPNNQYLAQVDANTFYGTAPAQGTVRFDRVVAGVFHETAVSCNGNISCGQWYQLKVTTEVMDDGGNWIRVWAWPDAGVQPAKPQIDLVDYGITAPGQLGTSFSQGENARYDDIRFSRKPQDTAVKIWDTVPAQLTYVSASTGGSFAGGIVSWNVGSLEGGQRTVSFTATVNVGQAAGTYSNCASASSSLQANIQACASYDVAYNSLSLTKTVAPLTAALNDTLTYGIHLSQGNPSTWPLVIDDDFGNHSLEAWDHVTNYVTERWSAANGYLEQVEQNWMLYDGGLNANRCGMDDATTTYYPNLVRHVRNDLKCGIYQIDMAIPNESQSNNICGVCPLNHNQPSANGGDAVFIFRYNSNGNLYHARLSTSAGGTPNTLFFDRMVGWTWTNLSSINVGTVVPGDWWTVKVMEFPAGVFSLKAWKTGTAEPGAYQISNFSDNSFPDCGRVGVQANGGIARWDNLKIWAPVNSTSLNIWDTLPTGLGYIGSTTSGSAAGQLVSWNLTPACGGCPLSVTVRAQVQTCNTIGVSNTASASALNSTTVQAIAPLVVVPTCPTTPTNTSTPTASPTRTATPTFSSTSTRTSTSTSSATPSATLTRTQTPSATPTATLTSSVTVTVTPTNTPSSSATMTRSATPSPSATPTASPSFTGTRTATESITFTESASNTPTRTASPTFTASPTPTQSASVTATPTGTPSSTDSPSATQSASITATRTVTTSDTATPTATESASVTSTPTQTLSNTVTLTRSPSLTATPSATPSSTVTETLVLSPTPTGTVTASFSATPTPSETPSLSFSPTVSDTPTASPSITDSPSPSPSLTATPSFSHSPTRTASVTISPTFTPQPPLTMSVDIYNEAGELVARVAAGVGVYGQPTGLRGDTVAFIPDDGQSALLWISGSSASVRWDGANGGGQFVGSGTYTIRIGLTDSFGSVTSYSQDVQVLRKSTAIQVNVYNSAGELVRRLSQTAGTLQGGNFSLSKDVLAISGLSGDDVQLRWGGQASPTMLWDGRDSNGNYVSSGVYVISTVDAADHAVSSKSIMVLRGAPTQDLGVSFGSPNPSRPDTGPVVLLVQGLMGGSASGVVYDLAGEKVAFLSFVAGPDRLLWDVQAKAYSGGVYWLEATLINPEGQKRIVTKLALIR